MTRYIALFGPPGVGKSTLIDIFQEKGISAVDLEKTAPTYNGRLQELHRITRTSLSEPVLVFGAADLRITDFPNETKTILLLPPLKDYLQRHKYRNDRYPQIDPDPIMVYYSFKDKSDDFDVVYKEISSPVSLFQAIVRSFLDLHPAIWQE